MNKKLGLLFLVSSFAFAQEGFLNPSYIQNGYDLGRSGIEGTARYKSLSGSMGAVGGDLSAISQNPAAAGVIVSSVFSGSVDLGSRNIEGSSKVSSTRFNLNQAGIAWAMPTTTDSKVKNVVLSANVTNQSNKYEVFETQQGKSYADFSEYVDGNIGNLNLAAGVNVSNTWYFGLGLDAHFYDGESNRSINVSTDAGTFSQQEEFSPFTETGTGIGLSAGVIFKPVDELRLGVSYKSPVWWSMERDVSQYQLFDDFTDTSGATGFGYDNVVNRLSEYDMTTPGQFKASAAYVFADKGFINVDYGVKDYSNVEFKPQDDFSLENQYVSNNLKSSSSIAIGAEVKASKEVSLRAGYNYESSPFEATTIAGVDYKPYGDTSGFSAGLGFNFGNTFLDLAYNYSTRDRSFLADGAYLDITSITDDAAKLLLELNDEVINDIKENNHEVTLTFGVKF